MDFERNDLNLIFSLYIFNRNILLTFFVLLFVTELEQSSGASWTEPGGPNASRDPRGPQYSTQSHRRADGLSNFLGRALSGELRLVFRQLSTNSSLAVTQTDDKSRFTAYRCQDSVICRFQRS